MPRVLLFDYDGVLVDSLEIFMHHFIDACHTEGFLQINDKASFLHLFDKNLYESMLSIGMSLENILKIVSQVKDGLIRDQDKFRLFPGIGPMVKSLAYGHKLYVVTSNESSVVTSFLHSQGVTEFIDVFGSDKGGSKVNKISSIKNRYPVDTLFYIGDTKGDIYEGRKAGVNTVAVTWGWHTKKELETLKPDYLVEAPEQLIDLIV